MDNADKKTWSSFIGAKCTRGPNRIESNRCRIISNEVSYFYSKLDYEERTTKTNGILYPFIRCVCMMSFAIRGC